MKKVYSGSGRIRNALGIALTLTTAFNVLGATPLPFSTSFDSPDDFSLFTVKDLDNDGSTWSYDSSNGAVTSGGCWGIPNDWMFTPEFSLKAGREYSISFVAGSGWDAYEQHFAIKLGQGEDPADYTKSIADDIMVKTNAKDDFKYTFTPEKEGDYRIAFNIFKSAPFYGAVIDDISIEALTDPAAPAAVSGFSVEPGAKGALTAAISFTAPATTLAGEQLTSIDKITVTRDADIIKEFKDVQPGSAIPVINDEGVAAGLHTYTVTSWLGELQGVPSSLTVWIGTDIPNAPLNFFVSDNLDGSVTMDWELPEKGLNGGYIDKDKVSFQLFQYKQGEYIYLGDIDAGKTTEKFNIGNPEIEGQQMVLFALAAESSQGAGPATLSNEYLVGKPYTLPHRESFPGGAPENGIWIKHSGACDWSGTDIESFDNDKGAIVFTVPMDLESGTYTNAIESGMISLSGAEEPGLVFRYLAYPGTPLALNTLIRKNGGKEYEKVNAIDYMTIGGSDNEWRTVYVPLTDYKDASYITVSFEATASDPSTAVVVDAVEIRNVDKQDLAVNYSNLPKRVTAGQNLTLYVTVENLGRETAENFNVNLYSNGKKVVEKKADAIAPFATASYELSCPTSVTEDAVEVYAEVEFAGDADKDNDVTSPFSLTLERPVHDTVADLKAENDDNNSVNLTWSPVVPKPSTVTDDVEKYDPFTITDFEPWTAVDVDNLPSTGLGGNYPHKDEVFPFIVFNPVELGMPVDDDASDFKPHSGNQYFAAVTGVGQNDDWLISEKLSGESQTVSLFARSYNTAYGCEKFEILYSEGSRETADFKAPEGEHSFEVPAEWTEYKVNLPEGAKYFAIHYISPYVWMMMIDDITYSPAVPVVIGYNVYRDKELIGSTDNKEKTAFIDKEAPAGDHVYNVTVRYDENRESDLSNDATVRLSGVGEIDADIPTYIEVYDINGRVLFKGESSLNALRLQNGIYIVKSGDVTAKMMIK